MAVTISMPDEDQDLLLSKLSTESRLPPPPVILFKDPSWEGGDSNNDNDKPSSLLWIPDRDTLKFTHAQKVTWVFENMEEYNTAMPYVAEMPHVDYKGYADMPTRRVFHEAFYLYGVQLQVGEVEFMTRVGWTALRLADELVRRGTNGRVSVYARHFAYLMRDKSDGWIHLPQIDGSGVSAMKAQQQRKRDEVVLLPAYPGPPPPAYEEVVVKTGGGARDEGQDGEVVRGEQPPSYEEAVLVSMLTRSVARSTADVSDVDNPAVRDVFENDVSPRESVIRGVVVEEEEELEPEKVVRFAPRPELPPEKAAHRHHPAERQSRRYRLMRRMLKFLAR
ncbi:hypothetical protein F5Y17DRAFT_228004 [Xylariaceae sp. FL0594]|nr:hypothetical protein F5Y17DRAFT_228004 [Xylariaceae sp. FL0594]